MYPDHIRRIRATRLCRNRRRDRRFTRHRRRVGRHPHRLLLRHPLLFGGNDRNRLRLRFAILLRHDMQIEHGADAVAKFGEKVLQHIIIRFSALQIHQLLFPAIDNPIIVVVNPQRRMVENIQHFVASRHIGSRDLFPQHSPRDAFGVIFDQRCGYVPLADQIGLQLFRPSDRQRSLASAVPSGEAYERITTFSTRSFFSAASVRFKKRSICARLSRNDRSTLRYPRR